MPFCPAASSRDSQLPSENVLGRPVPGVSRPTVRRALALLPRRRGGLIVTSQGRGRRSFATEGAGRQLTVTGSNSRRHRALGLPGFNAQALEQGQRPRQEILEAGTVPATAEVAMRLDVDEGDPL